MEAPNKTVEATDGHFLPKSEEIRTVQCRKQHSWPEVSKSVDNFIALKQLEDDVRLNRDQAVGKLIVMGYEAYVKNKGLK